MYDLQASYSSALIEPEPTARINTVRQLNIMKNETLERDIRDKIRYMNSNDNMSEDYDEEEEAAEEFNAP